MEFLIDPSFYAALFGVTLIQLALGADNLIIITILANKLPDERRKKAINLGLLLAMVFRILLLCMVSLILRYANTPFFHFDTELVGLHWEGSLSGKSLVLLAGGLFLIWKGVKELRIKAKGHESEVKEGDNFVQVVMLIAGLNVLFSVDSILTVVGMTDSLAVMIGAVLLSVALMLKFAARISDFISKNPDFEILGLFVLLLIGFVLVLEGGHVAHLAVHESSPSLHASAEGAGDGDAARLHVDLLGGEAQLYQTALELEADTDYVLRFSARCSSGHDMVVHLQAHEEPHHNYGLSTGTVDLTPEWKAFEYSFKTPELEGQEAMKDGRLMFWLAPFSAVGDDYFLDKVELVRADAAGTNLIVNGSFAEGTHRWRAYSEESSFPYVPQWIVIFILLLMFSVDLYQNWLDKQLEKEQDEPVHLHRRNK
ncbi:MAG: TerC family protein [Planctomycetes bacterium]|nr:TerC family protein [Planctomycetota bacterium]